MADSPGGEADLASEPADQEVTEELPNAQGETKVDFETHNTDSTKVLLTERKDVENPQISLSSDDNSAESGAPTGQLQDQVNALATEVVKSSIELAVSEHHQEVVAAVNSLTDHIVTETAVGMDVREKAMSLTDKVLGTASTATNDEAHDNPISECGTLGEMGADSVFEYSAETYLEPVPDPYKKAISYLEKHNILQLFQGLTSSVVLNQPTDPLEAMLEQLQFLKNPEPSAQSINLSELNVS